jgi:tetratricopeptide (TPR) repeat protein
MESTRAVPRIRPFPQAVLGILLLCAAGPAFPLYGQDAPGKTGPVFLAAEIQHIEQALEAGALSGVERREGLGRLGRLFRLSGNIEAAARAWTEAAFAEPGRRDDAALLEGARCLAALGEFERADAHIKTVLLTGREAAVVLRARLLGAQIEAFRTGNPQILSSLLDNPDYGDQKPALYYTLWKIAASNTYRERLIAEYPESPEARIAGSEGNAVSVSPSALWFFFPGRESLTLSVPSGSAGTTGAAGAAGNAGPAGSAATAGGTAGEGQPRPVVSAAVPLSAEPGPGGDGPRSLQTGIFGREENAASMAARLSSAGFSPAILLRRINDVDYWAVTVPPGQDPNQTMLR